MKKLSRENRVIARNLRGTNQLPERFFYTTECKKCQNPKKNEKNALYLP